MVFKSTEGHHVYRKYVKYKAIAGYMEGTTYPKAKGVKIRGAVRDGRKGLFKAWAEYPVQMHPFNQAAIVARCLTRKPKLQASGEFKEIMWLLPKTDKESFFGALDGWYEKWASCIHERAQKPETGKSRYIHKRLQEP